MGKNTTGLPWCDHEIGLDIPFATPEDRREYVHELWCELYEAEERAAAEQRMQDAADAGRALLEREDDELDDMRCGAAVGELMASVIPARAARRMKARTILDDLRKLSRLVEIRHGSVRVDPPAPQYAEAVREYEGEIGDLLDDEASQAHIRSDHHPAHAEEKEQARRDG